MGCRGIWLVLSGKRGVMRRKAASKPPVVAAPSLAPTTPEDRDPVFDAINMHHQATMAFLRAVNLETRLAPTGSKLKNASAVTNRAWDDFRRYSEKLVERPPTSLRGAQALLDYVCRFNRGEFKVGKGNYTEPDMWPTELHFLDEKLLTIVGQAIAEAAAMADAGCAKPAHPTRAVLEEGGPSSTRLSPARSR